MKKRDIMVLTLMIVALSVVLALPLTQLKADPTPESDAILLKARQFTPEHGGELLAAQESRHAIIQFEGQPQQDTLESLSVNGVNILGYIPRHAVMAFIPANTDMTSIPGIRWVGALKPTDKVSRLVDISLDKGFILVDVFSDITREEAEGIISSSGGEIVENPHLVPNTYLVGADENVVAELSQTDAVSWIWAASDAIIEGLPVHSCPGPMTVFGLIANYVIHHDGWDGPGRGSAHDLTYHFENGTTDIPGDEEQVVVEAGINEWTKYAAITWTETASPDQNRSMDILWGTYDHGCGYPFDGPGGVLAHCFYPANPNPEPIAGDMHFDDSETWKVNQDNYDLFSVALHEAGHGLGLGHSENPNAVMYPYYQMVTGLHQDDIDGIQAIYATSLSILPDYYWGSAFGGRLYVVAAEMGSIFGNEWEIVVKTNVDATAPFGFGFRSYNNTTYQATQSIFSDDNWAAEGIAFTWAGNGTTAYYSIANGSQGTTVLTSTPPTSSTLNGQEDGTDGLLVNSEPGKVESLPDYYWGSAFGGRLYIVAAEMGVIFGNEWEIMVKTNADATAPFGFGFRSYNSSWSSATQTILSDDYWIAEAMAFTVTPEGTTAYYSLANGLQGPTTLTLVPPAANELSDDSGDRK